MKQRLFSDARFHFDNLHFDNPLKYGPYTIMQVGDLAAGSGYECQEHIQEVDEITYVVSGKGIFYFDGEEVSVSRGDVIFNKKSSRHAIVGSEEDPIRYFYIGFVIDKATTNEDKQLSKFLKTTTQRLAKAHKSVFSAFQDIFNNMLNSDEFSKKLTEDAVRKLIVWAKRSFELGAGKIYSPEEEPEKNRMLSEICLYLESSVEDRGALKNLPKMFSYSYSYLSSVFSKAMGVSLREYFLIRRYEKEYELLSQGNSVTAVAEKMGYGSVHSFSHAFSARAGIPPSQVPCTKGEEKKD